MNRCIEVCIGREGDRRIKGFFKLVSFDVGVEEVLLIERGM